MKHRELYLVLYDDLCGKRTEKRVDTCARITDSLYRTAETGTAL